MSGGEEGVRWRKDVGRKRHSTERESGQEAQHGRGCSWAPPFTQFTSRTDDVWMATMTG